MGILAMKVMGGMVVGGAVMSPAGAARLASDLSEDDLQRLPAAAIRWSLSDERIQLLCIGHGSAEEIDRNIAILSGDTMCSEADRVLLARFGSQAYPVYRNGLEARLT
jgi:hypothetical protein